MELLFSTQVCMMETHETIRNFVVRLVIFGPNLKNNDFFASKKSNSALNTCSALRVPFANLLNCEETRFDCQSIQLENP